MTERRISIDHRTNSSLEVSRVADTETIAVSGELDVGAAVRVAEAVGQAETGGAAQIVIDLEAVEGLDRAALAMLWKVRVRLRGWGDRLRLTPPDSYAVQHFIARVEMTEPLFGNSRFGAARLDGHQD